MRDYERMWKALRTYLEEQQGVTLSRMVLGTKDEFERFKGSVLTLQDIEQTVSEIERREFYDEMKEDPDGRSP